MIATACALAGCATGPAAGSSSGADAGRSTKGPPPATEPYLGTGPSPTAPATPDADAIAQADAWLEAVVLPAGAVPSGDGTSGFSSYTGWPCAPIAERQAAWLIPDAGVVDTTNWIREHPPAGLVSTAIGPYPDDIPSDSAITGFTPENRSQQGVVLTVERRGGGVAVRAEVAALGATSVCPPPPDGGEWGLPGQG